jgi:hypothetical protein
MVVVYLPKEKIIFESDAYNPGAVGAVTNPTSERRTAGVPEVTGL